MDFWFEKQTLANVSYKGRKKTKLKLPAGTIVQVWMYHPEGCDGLAYAIIRYGKHQLYPTNPETAYHGGGVPMTFPDNLKLGEPVELTLETWNSDDTYPHYVYVRITVLRFVIEKWKMDLSYFIDKFRRMVGV